MTCFSNGELVIAVRGTDNVGDALTDIELLKSTPPDEYYDFKKYVNSMRDQNPGTTISLTGHSLGGAYIQLYDADVALHPTEGYAQLLGTTFGATGMSAMVWQTWNDEITGKK